MKFRNSMVLAALATVFAFAFGFEASAKGLEGNVIIRYNPSTGQTEQLKTSNKITSEAQAHKLAEEGNFRSLSHDKVAVREADREAGASSWYWYNPGYSYTPQYYYYGVNYQSYYTYYYQNCYYYYYGARNYYNSWWR